MEHSGIPSSVFEGFGVLWSTLLEHVLSILIILFSTRRVVSTRESSNKSNIEYHRVLLENEKSSSEYLKYGE